MFVAKPFKALEPAAVLNPAAHVDDILDNNPTRLEHARETTHLECCLLAFLGTIAIAFRTRMARAFGRCDDEIHRPDLFLDPSRRETLALTSIEGRLPEIVRVYMLN